MSNISGNTCSIVTILPLGVECYSVNSSTPTSTDGAIYLTITGGTPPYNISWDNQLTTPNLYNLGVGSYTATITDYYGDYSATTSCVVESNSFYLDYFVNCDSGNLAYFTGLTQNQLLSGGVYQFETTSGCWTYSGKSLYTGQTYTGDVLSVYFQTCEECNPSASTPYYPTTLCLYSTNGEYIAYPFSYAGQVNDKPSYSGSGISSSGYTIQYVQATYGIVPLNKWVVLNKTGNELSAVNDNYNPLGSWNLLGTQQSWLAVSGSCPSVQELDFTMTINNESCDGSCDGSILVNAVGGTSGYTYSLDGSTYQVTPVFNNLCDQTGTIYVKDSSGNTSTQNYTILSGPKKETYKLSISTTQTNTQLNYGNKVTARLDYIVNVTPELPDGVSINVPLVITEIATPYSPGTTLVSLVSKLYSGSTLVAPSTSALTNTLATNRTDTNCTSFQSTAYTYSVNYNTLKLTKGMTISGTVTSSITKSGTTSSAQCYNFRLYNPGYNWVSGVEYVDCAGTSKTTALAPEASKTICAQSVNINSGAGYFTSTNTGSCGCATNGNAKATVGFNSPSMNDTCSVLQVQTPPTNQLYSQLYQT